MKKEDKIIAIQNIAKTIQEYGCFYLVETAGLDAEKTTSLRRACNKADIKLMVVKNTLLHKALESLEGDYTELYGVLHGSTSLMLSNTGNAPAKLIKEILKADKRLNCPLSRLLTSRRPSMSVPTSSTLVAIKSKTSLSPTLSLFSSHPPRTLSPAFSPVATSFTASSRPSRRKRLNLDNSTILSTPIKTTKHLYNHGRSQSFCRTTR